MEPIALPASFDRVTRVCATVSAMTMALAGVWLELAIFGRSSPEPTLSAILHDPKLGPFLLRLAIGSLGVGAAAFWGAKRTRRFDRGGRQLLIGAMALGHCLAFITLMVQFTWLPLALHDLNPTADPYHQLAHHQKVLLVISLCLSALVVAFDIWFGYVMTRPQVQRAFADPLAAPTNGDRS